MTIKNKFILTFLLTLVALFFLKTDYRMIETIYPGADDGDHYLHATTIGIDFDLDYTNQLKGVEILGITEMERLHRLLSSVLVFSHRLLL